MTGEELMCAFLRYGITVKSIVSFTQTRAKTLASFASSPNFIVSCTPAHAKTWPVSFWDVCIDTLALCQVTSIAVHNMSPTQLVDCWPD